jgi:hypothetical protein
MNSDKVFGTQRAYDSPDRRTTVRAKVLDNAEWQEFLKVASPLLAEMNATIVVPT